MQVSGLAIQFNSHDTSLQGAQELVQMQMHLEEPRWVPMWWCKYSCCCRSAKGYTHRKRCARAARHCDTLVIVHLGLNFDIGFDAAYGEELYTDIASNFPASNIPLSTPDMLTMTF